MIQPGFISPQLGEAASLVVKLHTGYSCARRAKCIDLISLTKNLWYEECEQLDSDSGGALSQGAGHDRSFYRYAV